MLTKLKIVDNSGATSGRIIKLLNKKKQLSVGSLVIVSITKNIPHSKIRRGDMQKAIVISGNYKKKIRMQKLLVLVKIPNKGNEYSPIATRIKAPINAFLKRNIGMQKIANLSKRSI